MTKKFNYEWSVIFYLFSVYSNHLDTNHSLMAITSFSAAEISEFVNVILPQLEVMKQAALARPPTRRSEIVKPVSLSLSSASLAGSTSTSTASSSSAMSTRSSLSQSSTLFGNSQLNASAAAYTPPSASSSSLPTAKMKLNAAAKPFQGR